MGSRKTGRVRFKLGSLPGQQEFHVLIDEEYVSPPGYVAIEVPAEMIQEVVQYVPDEPTVANYVVRATVNGKTRLFERAHDDLAPGAFWFAPGISTGFYWSELIQNGEPEIVFDPGHEESCNCGCQ